MLIKGNCDFLLLLILIDFIDGKDTIWRFDSDISNPVNWVNGKLSENCKGIHFAQVNTAPIYVNKLTTAELILPSDGEIGILDGGSIEFKDNKKCIKLQPINYHDWYNPDSWTTTTLNSAMPDKERIPCVGDTAIFPKYIHTRVYEILGASIKVGSVKFEKEIIDNHQMEFIMASDIGKKMFFNPIDPITFNIEDEPCNDPYGCVCHRDSYIPCPLYETNKKATCLNPIEPEEFCKEICGASLTFKPESGPKMSVLQKKLADYTVDTYASRVKDYLGNDVIQVVFSEKEYTGKSLTEAQNFNGYLLQHQAENLQMQQSGHYYVEGGSSSLSIIFGTLLGVIAFFSILFYVRGDTSFDQIISRFSRNRGSIFNMPFFARFDNTDENLIIDGQSLGGSIIDIAKSFDNPMYGQSSPSTSTESQHENPLYDVVKDKDDVEE